MRYYSAKIDWLLAMFSDGYITILDADKQEIIDCIFE